MKLTGQDLEDQMRDEECGEGYKKPEYTSTESDHWYDMKQEPSDYNNKRKVGKF